MKILVKTLKGTSFDLEVKPDDMVVDVKKKIETVQGSDVYPAAQLMMICQGKVINDDTTLEENKVAENSFVVIMLTKNKRSPGESSTTSAAPIKAPQSSSPPPALTPAAAPQTAVLTPKQLESGVFGEAASNLVSGNNLEGSIQQILDMGGGTWDRDTVIRALRAAHNNPERAIEYLYSGIPEQAEVSPVGLAPGSGQAGNSPTLVPQLTEPTPVISSGPNANPLDLFPQSLPVGASGAAGAGSLDFLRNGEQFQVFRAMVQDHPEFLQHLLQELGKRNPEQARLIQERHGDFLQLISEPVQEVDGNLGEDVVGIMPQDVHVTPEDREAMERLEGMGFDAAIVLEVFFACNKNEELAANYLLDHLHEFDD